MQRGRGSHGVACAAVLFLFGAALAGCSGDDGSGDGDGDAGDRTRDVAGGGDVGDGGGRGDSGGSGDGGGDGGGSGDAGDDAGGGFVGCGDGTLAEGEACDDGNRDDGDTCSADCGEVAELMFEDQTVCLRLPSGGVECWGARNYSIGADPAPVVFMAMAFNDLCVTRADGSIACVGGNSDVNNSAYWPAGPINRVWRVGPDACAELADGSITCWGNGIRAEPRHTPPEGARYEELAGVNYDLSYAGCGIVADGSISCYGDTAATGTASPPTGSDWVSIHGGNHVCAMDSAGGVACFGSGAYPTPAAPFASVRAGEPGACAVSTSGGITCWPEAGNIAREEPAGRWLAVDMGYRAACALDTGGRVYCWGQLEDFNLEPPARFRSPRTGDGEEVDFEAFDPAWLSDGFTCDAQPTDGDCLACVRSDCCALATTCASQDGCPCLAGCLVESGGNFPLCFTECGIEGGSFERTPLDLQGCVSGCTACQ
jgi:cysteine-rich repeat protein